MMFAETILDVRQNLELLKVGHNVTGNRSDGPRGHPQSAVRVRKNLAGMGQFLERHFSIPSSAADLIWARGFFDIEVI